MKSLQQEILSYVSSKTGVWSDSTISTVYSKLITVLSTGLQPDQLYKKLSSEGYSRYTIKMYFTLAQQYEADCYGTTRFQTWTQSNRLKFKNAYKKKVNSITDEQYASFLVKALEHSTDMYNLLILLGKAGLRKGEALGLTRDFIKDNQLEVRDGKGQKQRFIPFNSQWLLGDASVIVSATMPYWKFFKDHCEGFTPHDFRAYYATKIVNLPGMSIEDARDLLGHNDIKTTARYLRANKERRTKLIMENF